MRIYLAGAEACPFIFNDPERDISDASVLASVIYWKPWMIDMVPRVKAVMLDSGAFSFLSGAQKDAGDIDGLMRRYIDLVNTSNPESYIEMDLDEVVGLPAVEKMRERLERETGRRPIPVWHVTRGKQYWLDMCQEYDRVALGGVAIKVLSGKFHKYFPWFIREAHKRGTKVHCLGFTNQRKLRLYDFDSVDSSTWLNGGKYGVIYSYRNGVLTRINPKRGNHNATPYQVTHTHNFEQWVAYSRSLEEEGI